MFRRWVPGLELNTAVIRPKACTIRWDSNRISWRILAENAQVLVSFTNVLYYTFLVPAQSGAGKGLSTGEWEPIEESRASKLGTALLALHLPPRAA
jgi:hypothetical protein